MDEEQNGRRPKWKTTTLEDDQNKNDQIGRQQKQRATVMEDDQNGR